MSQTINIKDIPGHRVDVLMVDFTFPYLLQFNFHFSHETQVDFHSRSLPIADSPNHIATWKVKHLH